ncbi:uncharacterized protein GGS22DRAFT_185271 [Annulohypoxylon maeteangense]|uniref:uncharacterized protein n=1 Tax=Annulohypoxylon maeteangense TaxID=1927788 RepID=UPI00200857EC|nr:uncharacterized protein GGS22DRAFT_185271 [Annulohypoxylon maeteangense]KAI0887889.1 hypothetical protein GGS22DRAFT_185271 [Annulohypoxylon maeteangense]
MGLQDYDQWINDFGDCYAGIPNSRDADFWGFIPDQIPAPMAPLMPAPPTTYGTSQPVFGIEPTSFPSNGGQSFKFPESSLHMPQPQVYNPIFPEQSMLPAHDAYGFSQQRRVDNSMYYPNIFPTANPYANNFNPSYAPLQNRDLSQSFSPQQYDNFTPTGPQDVVQYQYPLVSDKRPIVVHPQQKQQRQQQQPQAPKRQGGNYGDNPQRGLEPPPRAQEAQRPTQARQDSGEDGNEQKNSVRQKQSQHQESSRHNSPEIGEASLTLSKPLSLLAQHVKHVPVEDISVYADRDIWQRRKEANNDGQIKSPCNQYGFIKCDESIRPSGYGMKICSMSWHMESWTIRSKFNKLAKTNKKRHDMAFSNGAFKVKPQRKSKRLILSRYHAALSGQKGGK